MGKVFEDDEGETTMTDLLSKSDIMHLYLVEGKHETFAYEFWDVEENGV